MCWRLSLGLNARHYLYSQLNPCSGLHTNPAAITALDRIIESGSIVHIITLIIALTINSELYMWIRNCAGCIQPARLFLWKTFQSPVFQWAKNKKSRLTQPLFNLIQSLFQIGFFNWLSWRIPMGRQFFCSDVLLPTLFPWHVLSRLLRLLNSFTQKAFIWLFCRRPFVAKMCVSCLPVCSSYQRVSTIHKSCAANQFPLCTSIHGCAPC